MGVMLLGPHDTTPRLCRLKFTCSYACCWYTQVLRDEGEQSGLANLVFMQVLVWSLFTSVFVLRFMTLGTAISGKYRSSSILLTEQINLYLKMMKSPEKKNDLIIANNVLKLAAKLLKELETSNKLAGISMSPVLFNFTRVVLLSAFSAVVSDLLGFKLKLWKLKM